MAFTRKLTHHKAYDFSFLSFPPKTMILNLPFVPSLIENKDYLPL